MAREKKVEQILGQKTQEIGGLALKWISPGNAGVPDRIVFLPVPSAHQEIVNRYVKLVETKAPGEQPNALQVRVRHRLAKRGITVHVVDCVEDVIRVLRS